MASQSVTQKFSVQQKIMITILSRILARDYQLTETLRPALETGSSLAAAEV
jgi:hypothetical protein